MRSGNNARILGSMRYFVVKALRRIYAPRLRHGRLEVLCPSGDRVKNAFSDCSDTLVRYKDG